ncbi:MAG: SBBP repeat-containing protein, partial [Abitibacteriaceae bacterium]|nr:SBBP repeat-containing protein [Abditibacteriaceae bacterium]
IGFTSSSDFPTTPGAYDRSYNTNQDAFISKLNPAGAGTADLVYSTYLGGSDADYGLGIAVDGAGMIYATGSTYSNPFPTTNGAYQTTHGADGGGLDAFISKLNPVGGGTADLVYSTYLGGSNDEGASGISVDSGGAIYVVGTTSSPDFPTTPNAYQTTSTNISDPNNPFPLNDAFVSKLLPPTATAVKLISFTATRYTGVLWLNWQTGYEVDNLGFNVYREGKGKRVRLNRTGLIAGSALQGAGSGETYAWPDALQAPGTKYWLEDVDTRGKSTWHGPITPRVSTRSAAAQRRSPLLGAMAVSP